MRFILDSWLNAFPDLCLHGDVEAPDVRVAVAVVDEGGGVESLNVGVEVLRFRPRIRLKSRIFYLFEILIPNPDQGF